MEREIFCNGLLEYGYKISEEKEDKFRLFSSLLVEWNKKFNLTAVTDPEGISVKHFLDSVIPLFHIDLKENTKIIDIGTGAGFPGLPLKIMREDLDFTFLDSLNKRITFLKEVSRELDLNKVEFLHARAEDAGRDKNYREKYDYAVSRAVASLKVLSEYSLPFLKVGGFFYAFKAFDIEDEVDDAKCMIGELGGKIREIKEVKIPYSDITRKIVFIEKVKETSKQFPRRSNKIK